MNERKLLIIYASVHGQAERIARRVAEVATESGVTAAVRSIREVSRTDLESTGSVVIVASVRFGRHARALTRFVKANRDRLAAMHSAFLSVSGSAADVATRPEAERYVREFIEATGWTPGETVLFGGAIPFSRYNFLLRFVTLRASKPQGRNLDPSRDYDFTDWNEVRRFALNYLAHESSKVA